MSSFTKPLTVTKLTSRRWRVAHSFRYYVGHEGSEEYIDVPEGFVTDFASVPRAFWVIIPPDGKYTQAAVLHDYMYTVQEYTRKECDKTFLEAMKILGVPRWKRYAMYYAVRSFGWIPWKG